MIWLRNITFILIAACQIHEASASWSKQPEDNLKVELGISTPTLAYSVKAPKEISKSVINYQPHSTSKTALGLSYRNIGASISTINPASDESTLKLGHSKSNDLQLRLFGKRTYELFYQTYEGYYIENSADIDSNYTNSDFKILRPDIKTKNYGFNFYWNVNEKDFSQAIAYDQMGVQKSSAWGLSWLAHGSQSSIEGDSPLVPDSEFNNFGNLAQLKHLHRNNLAVGVGLGGILSWKNLYLAGLLALGLGSQNITYQMNDSTLNGSDNITGTYVSGRASLGFNGPRNVVGLQILSDSVTTSILKGEITGSSMEFKLFYAYRFDGVNIKTLNYISSWFD